MVVIGDGKSILRYSMASLLSFYKEYIKELLWENKGRNQEIEIQLERKGTGKPNNIIQSIKNVYGR